MARDDRRQGAEDRAAAADLHRRARARLRADRGAVAPLSWHNWAGQQTCAPARVESPRDEEELAGAIAGARARGLPVRAVGSGHSFTDICCTDGCLIDLSRMNRVLEVNAADRLVRVQPGIRLHDLAERLSREGLALENQGDVDVQTLAGALATATHGTGLRFANLSSQLVACRLAGAGGELHEIDASDEESLLAARVSLGALGIMSEVTIRVVPSFRLRRVEEPRRVADVLERLQQSAEAHDHFELFAFPYSGRCLTLESERTDEPARPMPRWREVLLDDVVANGVFGLAVRLGRRFPSLAPRIGSAVGGLLQASERLDDSHRVFANTRRVHFTEMEYALPRDAAADALLRVTALIERRRLPVNFPIELRFVAGDEGFLSTAHGRDTAYIAVHQYVGMEYEGFFRAAEAIFDEYGGRPHWGKRHYQSAATLASRYPAWERFQRVRARFDPGGLFTNDYLKRVLGPVQVPAAA